MLIVLMIWPLSRFVSSRVSVEHVSFQFGREQSRMAPEDIFGKLELPALFLLERSADLAQNLGQEFETLHIILMALIDPEIAGGAMQSFARYVSDENRKPCEGAIRVQLHLHSRPATAVDTPSASIA